MTSTEAPAARPNRFADALVALLYLALVLWVQRSILPHPGRDAPMPASMLQQQLGTIYQGDQRFVFGTIATNVYKLLHHPGELAGFGFCYPLRASYTLGEHMFGESLLALPIYLATGDPLIAYNGMVVLTLWITALAMYALARYWTRNVAAAFVAGMAFAFHAARLSNPGHPFVHGNLWTPLALLYAHHLFTRRRWRDAALLALFIVLQLLESFYQVLALAILGGVYGTYLLARHRRALVELLPKLLAVAAVSAAAAWLVFAPYLATRARWGVLQGRPSTLLTYPREYLPGGGATVGAVALVLAALGLADRARGPRRVAGEDPRLILTAAGLLVFWCTLWPLDLPLVGWRLFNPLRALADVVPGLDAVRVLGALRFGVYLVVALLAAYGVLLLVARLRARSQAAVAALFALLILAEAFDTTRTLVPRSAALAAYRVYPPAEDVQLVQDLPDGAVLDLPLRFDGVGKLIDMPSYITLAAYHERPTAACYNSFPSPLQDQVARLVARLPDPAAADALYAAGFRTVLVHGRRLPSAEKERLAPLLADAARMHPAGEAEGTLRFDLASPFPVSDALSLLAEPSGAAVADAGADARTATIVPPASDAGFPIANRSATTSFRAPAFAPQPLTARWRDAAGRVVATARARGLLPIALAPGDAASATVTLEVPPGVASGVYDVELLPAGASAPVLSRRAVRLDTTATAAPRPPFRRRRAGARWSPRPAP